MKANELKPQDLRLGNWVLLRGKPSQINVQGLCEIDEGYLIPEPISIQPDILEKAGFEKVNSRVFRVLNKNLDYIFRMAHNGNGWYPMDMHTNLPMQHLHQLQNLYYCLCGEELDINL
jgi:hypothetical protein